MLLSKTKTKHIYIDLVNERKEKKNKKARGNKSGKKNTLIITKWKMK